MLSSPLVTIAIPTYNRAETYFPQALRSALRQTYPNLEVIVADNNSTDGTEAMVRSIADGRLRYFRHEPGIGQRNNYNFCFDEARGSYVLLLHDDDVIDDDFVATCMAGVSGTSDVGIILTGVRIIDAEGTVVQQVPNKAAGLPVDEFLRSWFSGKAPIYCCNTLLNTQKLREIGGFHSKHFTYPDTMAIFRLAAGYSRIDIGAIKASFRVHGNEAGASRKISEWCEESLDLLNSMCDLAPQSRAQILKEGNRFLARANFGRAAGARLPLQRAVAMMTVMKYFRYRQFPSLHLILKILQGTPLYSSLQFFKRRTLGPLRAFTPE